MSEKKITKNSGFSLVETLVTAFIFCLIAVGIYGAFSGVMKVISASRQQTDAMLLANEQIEVVRGLPYADVGIVGGLTPGKIAATSTFVRNGQSFLVTAGARSIDDPFDGTIGGTPNDTAPSDYKLVTLDISCVNCRATTTYRVSTTVAPKSLETSSGNGALFIKVFNANGVPVSGASVRLSNTSHIPAINENDTTNNSGVLQLVDVPPGTFAYNIIISKNGFSTSRTYKPGVGGNTNPTLPDATVATGTVTQTSFAIDVLSQLSIKTTNDSCQIIPDVTFGMNGSKKIGNNPVIYKYSQNLTTDSLGQLNLSNIEWDTYNFSLPTSSAYVLAGSLPTLSVDVAPGSIQNISLILMPNQPNNLLTTVKDSLTNLPLSGATVLAHGSYGDRTLLTNRGYVLQTDWSGGAGQTQFIDSNKFDESSNINYTATPGNLSLQSALGQYVSSGYLTSSIFDSGTASTTYYNITWSPMDQATSTGVDSVKFQLASSNDPATTTWNFLGPDGTETTYYTTADTNVNENHSNERYLRYKVYFSTADSGFTPNLSDVSVTYSSECLPFGQALFSNLSVGTTTVTVSSPGYQSNTQDVYIDGHWQTLSVPLIPQ